MKLYLLPSLLLAYNLAIGQVPSERNNGFTHIHYSPSQFYNAYNATTTPVLRILPGDTVSTESIDALGFDKDSVKRGERGNPLTGPFYIEGAAAGDVIAIEIIDLSLNRTFATTLNAFVPEILPQPQARQLWRKARLVTWNLDTINLIATPAKKYEHLSKLNIPLHPFLGSVGVAPPGNNSISSGGFGLWGGNVDCKAITKSATLYLPVFHDGAFLYLGDGHAAQGDGELNGDALETSMRFTFTVSIIKNEAGQFNYPRVENVDYIMAYGQAKNLDNALQKATQHLLGWLQHDYQLSIEEASQLIGPAVEYRIPKIASSDVGVVAMVPKKVLEGLSRFN